MDNYNNNDKQSKEKIKIPPLPEAAMEFNPLSLEDLIDEKSKPAELAETENIMYDVGVSEALKNVVSGVDAPEIVTDPEPTHAATYKDEFDINSTQNALDDFDEEGGIRKVVVGGPVMLTHESSVEMKVDLGNKVSDFNPGTVQNALLDSSVEGGVVSNKTTGAMKTEDYTKDGSQTKETDKVTESNKYRVFGFAVQFKSKNSLDEIVTVTKQISDYFEDLTKAMITVNGSKYLMPLKNGAFDVVDVVSGIPSISFQDQMLYTYTGGKIGMGGYWKRS